MNMLSGDIAKFVITKKKNPPKAKERKVAIRRFSKLASLLLSISKMHLIISVEIGFFP